MDIQVTKRDGTKEPLNIDKLHKVIFWATEGLSGVSASEVELRSQIQFSNTITTKDIQEIMIKSAADLISEEAPNYQYVAGRLVNYQLRKEVYGRFQPTRLYDLIKKNIGLGFYDPELLTLYTEEEWDEINSFVNHERDMGLSYVAMEQMRGKYLVQNRVTKEILETPQVLYALVSAVLFSRYPADTRIRWVRDYYDAVSKHEISLPTPIMAGVRTPERQFSSCVLIESDDSLDSIIATSGAIMKYVSLRAGIGIGAGHIRALGSPVRGGSTSHTGVTPYFKNFQTAVNSCSQGGVRKGSATLYYPIWHLEVETMLVLKNNKGIEDNRVRGLDYGVQFSKLFYERLIQNGNITLFSPSDVPGLYEAFFADQDEFRRLYEAAEVDPKIRKKVVKAIDLFTMFAQERKDTGRIYLMNVDNANQHSSFFESVAPVRMSNLCVAGDTVVTLALSDRTIVNMFIANIGPWVMEGGARVLSRNIQTGEDEFKPVTAFAKTSSVAKLLEIEDVDTGRTLRCTEDHQVYTKNRGYVRSRDLLENDVLCMGALKGEGPTAVRIKEVEGVHEVYDITVADNENFYANEILIHNCAEITLPTKPLDDLKDPDGEIALCTLSAINWGTIKSKHDFERLARLAVRALDELLDYQHYPVLAAKNATMMRRPIGVGIINFAYFLAKHGAKYSDGSGLAIVDEYAEAWSYYLIKASMELAQEKGPCPLSVETKYAHGIVPIDTRKPDVDGLVPHVERMDWDGLRADLAENGIRNSTVMALMPAETSAQIANATNGIEPPRALVSVKQSKHGVLKQVVPEVRKLKNKYELLWDQESPVGYLQLCAVLQKYIDQSISTNTSYNPAFYEDGKVPMSELLKHLLLAYKWGLKTLYYNNTADGQSELSPEDLAKLAGVKEQDAPKPVEDEPCDGCAI